MKENEHTTKGKYDSLILEIKQLSKQKRTKIQEKFLKLVELGTDQQDKEFENLLEKDKLYKGISEQTSLAVKASAESNGVEKVVPPDEEKNIIYYRVKRANGDITIELGKPKSGSVPEEILEFVDEIEYTQNTIKNSNQHNSLYLTNYLTRLETIARVGGTSTYHSVAKKLLNDLQTDFVVENWWKKKTPLITKLGVHTLFFFLALFIAMMFLKLSDDLRQNLSAMNVQLSALENWLFLLMGSSLGTWLSFTIFNNENNIKSFRVFSETVPQPFLKLSVMAITASFFYLLFITGFFNVSFGDQFKTETLGMPDNENRALLIGLFFGLSESVIGKKLRKQVDSFTGKFT